MSSQSCRPSVRVLIFRFLLRRLNVRVHTYLAVLFQLYLLSTLFQPSPAHATTTDPLFTGTEPHLHIHAQKQVTTGSGSEWAPVPIRFGSRWLVRNSLVRA
jgi:hypothetical protein